MMARKSKKRLPYQKIAEALDYVLDYCNEQEGCIGCEFFGRQNGHCLISEITEIRDIIEEGVKREQLNNKATYGQS